MGGPVSIGTVSELLIFMLIDQIVIGDKDADILRLLSQRPS